MATSSHAVNSIAKQPRENFQQVAEKITSKPLCLHVRAVKVGGTDNSCILFVLRCYVCTRYLDAFDQVGMIVGGDYKTRPSSCCRLTRISKKKR